MMLSEWESDQEGIEEAARLATKLEGEEASRGLLREALRLGATGSLALESALVADDARALGRLKEAGASLRMPRGRMGSLGICAQAGSLSAMEFLLGAGLSALERQDSLEGEEPNWRGLGDSIERLRIGEGRLPLEIAAGAGEWEAALRLARIPAGREAEERALQAALETSAGPRRAGAGARESAMAAELAAELSGRVGWEARPSAMPEKSIWRGLAFSRAPGDEIGKIAERWPKALEEAIERGRLPKRMWHPARSLERARWAARSAGASSAWELGFAGPSGEIAEAADRPDEWGLGMIGDALVGTNPGDWNSEAIAAERLESLRAAGARLERADPGWESPIRMAWRLSKRDGMYWSKAMSALGKAHERWGETMGAEAARGWAREAAAVWLEAAGKPESDGKRRKVSGWGWEWGMEREAAKAAMAPEDFAATMWGKMDEGQAPEDGLERWVALLEAQALAKETAPVSAARRKPRRA